MSPEVAVTAVGAVTPICVGAKVSFDAWTNGRCGIADGVAACDEFQPEECLSVKEVRRTDRFTHLAIRAADEALTTARRGYVGAWAELPYGAHRLGCVIGTGTGDIATLTEQRDRLRAKGPRSVWLLTMPVLMGNSAARTLAMRYGREMAWPSKQRDEIA